MNHRLLSASRAEKPVDPSAISCCCVSTLRKGSGSRVWVRDHSLAAKRRDGDSGDVFLSGGQGQTESGPTTRWALSVAQQSHHRRSSGVVDRVYPADSIESVFRSLKSELGIRPIFHGQEHRADVQQKVRDAVEVKLYEHEGELYALAKSQGRQAKEIAIRRNAWPVCCASCAGCARACPSAHSLIVPRCTIH